MGRAIARQRWLLGFDSSQCGIYGEQIDVHANFSPNTSGLVRSIIPPILHTHFQFATTLVLRTCGRSLGTSKESNVMWDIGEHGTVGGMIRTDKSGVFEEKSVPFPLYRQKISRGLVWD
jgi:hypothetical protein